jgi:hypothetical protein
MKHSSIILSLLMLVAAFGYAATINIPANQPTIQAGINAAKNGDTVLVAPGTYFENINFMGKSINVKSSGGARVTIIDGGNLSTVVTFDSNEGLKSVLCGFTIQHGNTLGEGAESISTAPHPPCRPISSPAIRQPAAEEESQ